jgi:hypothetical protein
MIRRICASALFFVALGSAFPADWKAEFLSYLGPKADFRGALEYLSGQAKGLEPQDLQTAEALIPYLAWKLGDAAGEQDRISEYYEKYTGNDPEFGFLDDLTHRDFLNFWIRCKSIYPLVSDMNFLVHAGSAGSALPAGLAIGLELSNDVYYRLSFGPYSLEGGFWPKGFHILTIPAEGLFDRSGTYEFALDLRAGGLVIRKPIRIEVDLASIGAAHSPAFSLPLAQPGSKAKPAPAVTPLEGELALYVGGKLVMRSRKLAATAPPITIPLPGPSMPGTKPYLPPPKTNPMANSVSILDAIALTYKALKDIFAKKPPPPPAPPYQKVTSLSFSFARAAEDGTISEARAGVHLGQARGTVLRQ